MSLRRNVSHTVLRKLLNKHGVKIDEVEQCFANREGGFLEDTREKNRTMPPTLWFIAETDYGRWLKVVFIEFEDNRGIQIKTAYEPNAIEMEIYKKYGY